MSTFKNNKETMLLVTGGCGFIGSNFINLIMERYDKIKVINFDAMYYCANETNVNKKWRESNRYILVKGNLCSIDLVNHILNSYQPTHIIHFDAYIIRLLYLLNKSKNNNNNLLILDRLRI